MSLLPAEDPFEEFEIASFEPLEGLKRSTCPKCKCSRMYFCYTCYKYVVGIDESLLPRIKVSVKFDTVPEFTVNFICFGSAILNMRCFVIF